MFNNEDILTLAKAGFTAQQIAALNMVGTAPAPVAPAPVAPAPVAPALAPVAPALAPVAPAPVAPAPVTTAAPHTVDDVLSAITGLSEQMQQNNLLTMTQAQPVQKTATEVLAQIINPPTNPTEV